MAGKIFIVVFVLFCAHVFAGEKVDFVLDMKADSRGNLNLVMTPEKGFDTGKILDGKEYEKSLKISNSGKLKIAIESLRSPCQCIELEEAPERLDGGKDIVIKMVLDGEGYRGKITKNIHLRVKAVGESKDFFIPVSFTVIGEGEEPETAQVHPTENNDGPIKFVEYKGGGFEGYPKADAWIFSAKDCPKCNHTKAVLLPRLFEQENIEKPTVVTVDLDKPENFKFLSELEKKLNAKTSGETPIVLWKNKFIYGNDGIKELLKSN